MMNSFSDSICGNVLNLNSENKITSLNADKIHLKQLSFCHINIRSLLKKSDCGPRIDHLYNYACIDNHFDIIALTETHLSIDIDDNELMLDGYDIFRLDRNRHGGGVMLYCRSELRGKLLTPLHVDKIEMLWVELILGSAKIIFGVCYRPPNQNAICRTAFFDGLSNTFDLLQSKFKKKPFILVGDFNDRCHAWDDDHRNSELGLELVNLINSFYLTQMINQVTI